MIHNPQVNRDLEIAGVKFLQDTYGNQLISFDQLNEEDIVIIPAFGTTLEIESLLKSKNISTKKYNTTCPFVERVWKRAEQIGKTDFTIIIHGKHKHEETRATFSHSKHHAKSIIVKDLEEAKRLSLYIKGEKNTADFFEEFKGRFSDGFHPEFDLKRIGVINQTTMLASETQEIADFFREIMVQQFGEASIKDHFADTRDTLCYATNENQDATYGLLESTADLAVVVGGYNSSNTSHLVELLERKFPTYFISSETEIYSKNEIHHFDYANQKHLKTMTFIPEKEKVHIILTSGASCPDAEVEKVMNKILGLFDNVKSVSEVLKQFEI